MLVALILALAPTLAGAAQEYASIIMYHRVGDGRFPSTNVTAAQFRAHLARLEAGDYHVMSLPDLLTRLRAGDAVPNRTVAITFDDAYASVAANAHPLLAERGWPYTVFVSTDYIDRGFDGYMSWARMRALADSGLVTFGNHTVSHARLWKRRGEERRADWRQRVRAEVVGAQGRLVDELGAAVAREPGLLAYPYGEYDRASADLVADLGFLGIGQHSGAVGHGTDFRAVPRFAFNEQYADVDAFSTKVSARPLPVTSLRPWDPTAVMGDSPPQHLRLQLGEEAPRASRVGCFVNGSRVEVTPAGDGVRVALPALGAGRSRVNCTAPAGEGRFRWFGHVLINGVAD